MVSSGSNKLLTRFSTAVDNFKYNNYNKLIVIM
jgi:hypothetical protein